MARTNKEIIDKYLLAYADRDIDAVRTVMDENVTWHFPGRHPLAGVKKGIDEVITFYDEVGKIMATSKPVIEKLIVAEEEDYLIECMHITTNRTDENNINHHACVLWKFKDGKIIEGRHFFSDFEAVDKYFTVLAGKEDIFEDR